MEKYIYNDRLDISYTLQGDYYLPDLTLPAENEKPIGLWGQRHLRYIRRHRKLFYYNLLTAGKLNGYLADVDKRAEDMFFRLVNQMSNHEGITEKLKAENKMVWVARVNNIRNSVTEIVRYNLHLTDNTDNGGREINFSLPPLSIII